jgi:hypothetical protein
VADNEIQTADGSGSVSVQSEQPKAKAKATTTRRSSGPKLNARGVPVTEWDVPENDPNLRKHVGESPSGEGNKLKKVPGES